MDRRKFSGEDGLTLVEVVLSLALLAILSVVAFSIMQSTDLMMRRGTKEAQASQAMRAAVEEIKGTAHALGMDAVCGEDRIDPLLPEPYKAEYACHPGIHGLDKLYQIDVTVYRENEHPTAGKTFSFLMTEGGY